ncbi:hypothetical protein GCM10022419_005770 [Nonomuraea rosea]|uniref:Uncharacterized protein n=1 Tax=Nonomuraea rosea TaxID=638574 RepID=A0ABP6V7R1_9ACTN
MGTLQERDVNPCGSWGVLWSGRLDMRVLDDPTRSDLAELQIELVLILAMHEEAERLTAE